MTNIASFVFTDGESHQTPLKENWIVRLEKPCEMLSTTNFELFGPKY